MVSVVERFNAAVNVIRSLPKNGSYQLSRNMMLKFYGYYKHATEGACTARKPNFWDVVGQAKWEAWHSNRHLTKEQAMEMYVEGLREIIETMSFTDNVADFMGSISSLGKLNLDELEIVSPGMKKLAESHPNSPFHSRTNSPQHIPAELNGGHTTPVQATVNGHCNGHLDEINIEQQQCKKLKNTPSLQPSVAMNDSHIGNSTIDQSDDEYADPANLSSDLAEDGGQMPEAAQAIQFILQSMQNDITSLNERMLALQTDMHEILKHMLQRSIKDVALCQRRHGPAWWPFTGISPQWFAVLLLWPLVFKGSKLLLQRRE